MRFQIADRTSQKLIKMGKFRKLFNPKSKNFTINYTKTRRKSQIDDLIVRSRTNSELENLILNHTIFSLNLGLSSTKLKTIKSTSGYPTGSIHHTNSPHLHSNICQVIESNHNKYIKINVNRRHSLVTSKSNHVVSNNKTNNYAYSGLGHATTSTTSSSKTRTSQIKFHKFSRKLQRNLSNMSEVDHLVNYELSVKKCNKIIIKEIIKNRISFLQNASATVASGLSDLSYSGKPSAGSGGTSFSRRISMMGALPSQNSNLLRESKTAADLGQVQQGEKIRIECLQNEHVVNKNIQKRWGRGIKSIKLASNVKGFLDVADQAARKRAESATSNPGLSEIKEENENSGPLKIYMPKNELSMLERMKQAHRAERLKEIEREQKRKPSETQLPESTEKLFTTNVSSSSNDTESFWFKANNPNIQFTPTPGARLSVISNQSTQASLINEAEHPQSLSRNVSVSNNLSRKSNSISQTTQISNTPKTENSNLISFSPVEEKTKSSPRHTPHKTSDFSRSNPNSSNSTAPNPSTVTTSGGAINPNRTSNLSRNSDFNNNKPLLSKRISEKVEEEGDEKGISYLNNPDQGKTHSVLSPIEKLGNHGDKFRNLPRADSEQLVKLGLRKKI